MAASLAALEPVHPEFQEAVTATFRPEERRSVLDICKKGTDGTGYIEGKTFQRCKIQGGCLLLVLMVEHGYRLHVLLCGSISQYFNTHPIPTGTSIRLCTRGLAIEEGRQEPPVLAQRFVWREGVVIHVLKKTGEVFLDTLSSTRTYSYTRSVTTSTN